MLKQNNAIFVGGVGGGIGDGRDIHVAFDDDAFVNLEMMQGAAGLLVSDFDAHGLIGGVGEQSTFAGVDGIEQAFAGEFAALEDGEAAGVEGEFGFVFEPDGAERGAVRCGSTG